MGEFAFLIEIETSLAGRHRLDRRSVDEDDLRLCVSELPGRPVQLPRIIAVDKNKILPDHNEVERIDPLSRGGD